MNQIRQRAYGADFSKHKYTNSDFKTNEMAILKERDKEFVNEGKRWFDVIRMKDAKEGKLLIYADEADLLNTALFRLTAKEDDRSESVV